MTTRKMISEKNLSVKSAPMTSDQRITELVNRRQNVCIFEDVVGMGAVVSMPG
jgi:hypothetical protein